MYLLVVLRDTGGTPQSKTLNRKENRMKTNTKRNWIHKGAGRDLLIFSEDGRFEITRTKEDEFRLFDCELISTVAIFENKREAVETAEAIKPTKRDGARMKSIKTLKNAIEFVAGREGQLTPADFNPDLDFVLSALN